MAKTQRVVFSFDERSLESLQKLRSRDGLRQWAKGEGIASN